ncbi:MAG TPA: hypothetical protein ENH28_06395 [Euryarchaeota archaeon]|nr:hypothetical protein [Euryarchaeota archaeon]
MMNETFELTERENNFIFEIDGKTELAVAEFYVVYSGEKRKVENIFDGVAKLRDKGVKKLEIYTISGIKIVVDKLLNYSYEEYNSIPT